MSGCKVLQTFGFQSTEEPKSIYSFSPVYRVNAFIVKRTQSPMARANRLISYTTALNEKGINVVTPVTLDTDNPQSIGEYVYVVYPFIHGLVYSGKQHEIYEAGELLGKIHHLSPTENTYDLDEYDVFNFNNQEVDESVENIKRFAEGAGSYIDSMELKKKLLEIVAQQEELRRLPLPSVTTPHDYKANNLIYTPDPFLIDPDNALRIPKIFDLALALLLFHNEMATAPARMFTPSEWNLFLSGYKEYMSFTELEQREWNRALGHVFLDEVMWLMAEVEEDWTNPSQVKLFESLVEVLLDPSSYNLG
ncbi:phosphotransferase [Oceanobacillus saliphilus]|uniref:phosphotransferase n=1 Tax=Oceanobacillus saliphilus TaxID=2925834 RepID=UPI00201E4AE2|nr:phosphotransferase [Oceanobacillus saliphilus]